MVDEDGERAIGHLEHLRLPLHEGDHGADDERPARGGALAAEVLGGTRIARGA
eukprot:CAMPEP_0185552026 /NCGR_PEP_ID=MMETSP1381-20130426/31228_1 /TAXON_ID=298111 /ORGANISM="Pavlova sp., Strain CCMP459" /LENGTH=52 /DNA_ID=CAMNT_0028164957 /DNA_START=53 /DNA_END=207 /DNA_ORIENTATION=+